MSACSLPAGPAAVGLKSQQNNNQVDTRWQVLALGPDTITCIVCTASCFAPRRPDDVAKFAELAKKYQLPLLVNNAYGCQSRANMKLLTSAGRRGRVDGIVQVLVLPPPLARAASDQISVCYEPLCPHNTRAPPT